MKLLWILVALLGASAMAGSVKSGELVRDARAQIGVTTGYDPAYRVLPFPMGDVDPATGVCTDVIVCAYRGQGIDLQALVNADMSLAFAVYPQHWGLRKPDRNIDHRRVPNLQTFFRRHGQSLPASDNTADYRPGDIVTWMLLGNLSYIGIVSDKKSADGIPLIIHNIGAGTREEDILFIYPVTGHYRYYPDGS